MKKYGGFINREILGSKKINKKLFTINGRSSFNIILSTLKIKKIHIPFYICKQIIEVIKKNKIKFKFYEIDKSFNIKKKIKLKDNEKILVVNYFGLSNIKKKKNHIYDFSLALFDKKNKFKPSFNSLRKFINAGYGSFLNTNNILKKDIKKTKPKFFFKNPKTFKEFQKNEERQIINSNIYPINYLDKKIAMTNFKTIKKTREQNYKIYHKNFNKINILRLPNNPIGPLYYPLLIKNGHKIKKKLNKNKIFTPTLWKHLLNDKKSRYNLEKDLTKNCVFLPLDQRYQKKDIEYIVKKLIDNF